MSEYNTTEETSREFSEFISDDGNEQRNELNFDQSFDSVYDGNAAFNYLHDEFESENQAPVARVDYKTQILQWKKMNVENSVESVDNDTLEEDIDNISLPVLKEKLAKELVPLQQLRPPAGVATGVDVIDDFLLWRGIPKGDLTLLSGKPGAGATSLWIQTAAKVQAEKKWAAWINSDWELLPSSLTHKKMRLDKLLVVSKPKENSQLFWILQEMISSTLFEIIGLHVDEGSLKIHQLQKLKKLARTHQVALVIISHAKTWALNPLFSLVIDCQGDFFTIKRAAHRPTPFTIPGGLVHADLMSQLTANSRSLLR